MTVPARPTRRPSARARRLRASIVVGLLGPVLLAAWALWVDRRRDTDLADPRLTVTTAFRDAPPASAPRDALADAPITFEDATTAARLHFTHGPGYRSRVLPEDMGSGLAWGDYDGDGDWDLYVVNMPGYGAATPPPDAVSNRLFRNDSGRFTDVTQQAGVGDPDGLGMGASWADFDGDGLHDLYVTNAGPNRLFRNRGDGTFEDVADHAGVAAPEWSTGIAWGDFDRDGHLDLYVCSFVSYDLTAEEAWSLADVTSGPAALPFTLNPSAFDPVPNRLFRNRGDGTFEDVAAFAGVGDPEGRSLAATFVDLDGDGWLDLLVANDVSANRLFLSLGRDLGDPDDRVVFVDQSHTAGVADPRGSMGLALADLAPPGAPAPDGLPDVFITHWVAQENALYVSHYVPGGLEYRDRANDARLGEPSLDAVGWGCAFADFDLDGHLDLLIANGSTLEDPADVRRLLPQPLTLFRGDGVLFRQLASPPDHASPRLLIDGRGLALADFDQDGRIDVAVSTNNGRLLLLRNTSPVACAPLVVGLDAPSPALFGARVALATPTGAVTRWVGGGGAYLSQHAVDLVFAHPGGHFRAEAVVTVSWADGTEQRIPAPVPGRLRVVHPARRGAADATPASVGAASP